MSRISISSDENSWKPTPPASSTSSSSSPSLSLSSSSSSSVSPSFTPTPPAPPSLSGIEDDESSPLSLSSALPSLSSVQSISFRNTQDYFQSNGHFNRVLSRPSKLPSAVEVGQHPQHLHQCRRRRSSTLSDENSVESCSAIGLRLLYYVAFYTVLALCWVGYLNWYMYFQIPHNYPKLTGMQSALQMNPSLSFIPSPTVFNSLIHLRPRIPYYYYAKSDEMVAFLHAYQDNTGSTEYEDCVQEGGLKQDPLRPCTFDLNAGGPCNIQNGYGFETAQVCFVLKMTKIYGWLPDPVPGANGPVVKCSGVTEDDTYNLGIIRYYDIDYKFSALAPGKNPGKTDNATFHNVYFPYVNQLAYLQPLVFILFDGVKRNQLIRARCWLIANNIKVDCTRNEGCMNIEMLLD